MKHLKVTLVVSACFHLFIIFLVIGGLKLRERKQFPSVYDVDIVEAKEEISSSSGNLESLAVAGEEKVRVREDDKSRDEDEKIEEFLQKRKQLDELMKRRKKAEEREKKKREEKLRELGRWSEELEAKKSIEDLRLDSGEVVFPAWFLDKVHNRIFSAWEPAGGAGREGAGVSFDILRDGRYENIVIRMSSGNAMFDSSCLEAIGKASPFPALPELFKADRVKVHVTFKEE